MAVNSPFQTTLTNPVRRSGIGLHSARLVDLTILPAPADHGIVFKRTDVTGVDTLIPASCGNVADTILNTRIMNNDGVGIGTIEHLMAAFCGMGVDNALVEVNAGELPAMDGSAEPFCAMISEAGISSLKSPRKIIKVLDTIETSSEYSRAILQPCDALEIAVHFEFPDQAVGISEYFYRHEADAFRQQLAAARTFCRHDDVTQMRAAGYALGGSLDNAIVVQDGKILNETGLRFADEFVRHKVLDCLGDLYLASMQVIGRLQISQPGHSSNNQLLSALLEHPSAWVVMDADTMQAGHDAEAAFPADEERQAAFA